MAENKKADDILVLDLRKLTNITDYFVICSADSDTQIRAISNYIIDELKKSKEKYWQREGYESGIWVLLDYGDVVIHIFENQTRKYYELERLWGDAEVVYGKFPSV